MRSDEKGFWMRKILLKRLTLALSCQKGKKMFWSIEPKELRMTSKSFEDFSKYI